MCVCVCVERGVVSVCLGAAKGAFKTKREVILKLFDCYRYTYTEVRSNTAVSVLNV